MSDEGILDTHTDTQDTAGEPAPVVGETEHDKAMIAAADKGLDPNSANIQRTEEVLLAGKYKDENALNKGVAEILKMQYPDKTVEEIYKGLEKGTLVPSSPAAKAIDDADVDKGNLQEEDVDTTDTGDSSNPLDPVALTLELEENNGELTQATREKLLTEHKIPEATLDVHLAGIAALSELFIGKVYDITGGQDNYDKMLHWINERVPEAEQDVFNEQLYTQDINKVKAAVEGMNARFMAEAGSNPELFRPGSTEDGGINQGAYGSKAEWLSEVAMPEYQRDPAFRARVQSKLSKSKF